MNPIGDDVPVFVISVAAELAGMHPQTLRQYDRPGVTSPSRSYCRSVCGLSLIHISEPTRPY